MMLRKIAILPFLLACAATVAEASQEHVLQLTKFRLESASQTDPGTIVVHGSRDEQGAFRELKVELLGKVHDVPDKILRKIPAQSNGVVISSEPGYESLGGRTVYITFLVTWANAREIYRRFVVAVSKDGKSSIVEF